MNENLDHLLCALPIDLADEIKEALDWLDLSLVPPAPKRDLRSRFDELPQLDERELAELHAHLCRWAELYGEQNVRLHLIVKRVRRCLEETRLLLKKTFRQSAPQMPRDEIEEHFLQDEACSVLHRVVLLLDDMKALNEHRVQMNDLQVKAVSRALTGRQAELERERIENNVPARRPATRPTRAMCKPR